MATYAEIARAIRQDNPQFEKIKDDKSLVDAVFKDNPDLQKRLGQPIEVQAAVMNPLIQKAMIKPKPQEQATIRAPDFRDSELGQAGINILQGLNLFTQNAANAGTLGFYKPDIKARTTPGDTPRNPAEATEGVIAGLGQVAGNLGLQEAGSLIEKGAGVLGKSALAALGKSDFVKNAVEAVKNVINPLEIAQKWRDAVWRPMVQKSGIFGDALQQAMDLHPEKKVNLESYIGQIKNAVQAEALNEGATDTVDAVTKVGGKLQKFVSGELPARDMSLKEAQELLNDITESTKKGALTGKGRTPSDIHILDLREKLKLAMSESFPEMDDIRDKYSETIHNFNLLKPTVREGGTIAKLKAGIGDPEIRNLVDQYMDAKMVREVGGYSRAWKILSSVGIPKTKINVAQAIETNFLGNSAKVAARAAKMAAKNEKIIKPVATGLIAIAPKVMDYTNIIGSAIENTQEKK